MKGPAMNDDPYHDGGTRGSSGSDTSRDAAYADLVSGVTNATQKYVLIMAAQAGAKGITVADVREKDGGLHHGRISSAITKQHIAGRLVALTERRGHCGVYVLPEHVNGREVRPYRQQNPRLQVEDVEIVLDHHGWYDWQHQKCNCGAGVGDRQGHQTHLAEYIVALSRGEL